MELTRKNFDAEWPLIEQELRRCNFVAIDCEMTGIRLAGAAMCDFGDAVSKHFVEKMQVAQHYTLVQVGICFFTRTEANTYEARPFTAYVFPEDGTSDVILNVETSGEYLAKTKMDFNKWIKEGIRYVSMDKALVIRAPEAGTTDAASASRQATAEVRAQQSGDPFVMRLVQDMKQFSATEDANQTMRIPFIKNPASFEVINDLARQLGLMKISKREGQRTEHYWTPPAGAASTKERQIRQRIGFTQFFESLAELKKPVAFHNGFSDLLFLQKWFFGAAATDYQAFQRSIHEKFPMLFDTRVLMTMPDVPFDPRLPGNLVGFHAGLLARLGSRAASVKLPLGFADYAGGLLRDCRNDSSAHEAGFDALLTGIVLINAAIERGATDISQLAPFSGLVGVHACLYTALLTPAGQDRVIHDGVVLKVQFESAGNMNTGQVDAFLNESDINGRVQIGQGGTGAYVFVNSRAQSPEPLSSRIARATTRGRQMYGPRFLVSVMWQA